MSNDNDIVEEKLIEKRILVAPEDWKRVLEWTNANGIKIFFKDDSIHNTANMYLSNVKDILNSDGVKLGLGLAEKYMETKEFDDKIAREQQWYECPNCGANVIQNQTECTKCGYGLTWKKGK